MYLLCHQGEAPNPRLNSQRLCEPEERISELIEVFGTAARRYKQRIFDGTEYGADCTHRQ